MEQVEELLRRLALNDESTVQSVLVPRSGDGRDDVDVLVGVGPTVGVAGVVREAPRVALAIGNNVEDESG